MKSKMKYFLLVLVFSLSAIIITSSVSAHPPTSLDLQYDFGTQTLEVTVSHTVSDNTTHYILDIVISVNNVLNQTEAYSVQDTTSQHQDTFTVPTVHGDIIKVEAICNVAGSLTDTITVQDPNITETSFILSFALFALFSVSFGYLIMRKKRN